MLYFILNILLSFHFSLVRRLCAFALSMDSLAAQPEPQAQVEQSEDGQDEEEGSSCLLDASLLRAVTSLKAAAPGLFVSGWDNDTDENDEDEMETDDKECATLRAAEYGDLAALRKLLDEDVRLMHTRDSDGYTPMHRASYNDHPDAVRELLTRGADVGARTENGWTPLHCAACWGSVGAAQELLTCGADVNARTEGQLTPLHLAAACTEDAKKALRVAELLLNRPEVDVQLVSGAGDSAEQLACRCSRAMLALLRSRRVVDVESVDN